MNPGSRVRFKAHGETGLTMTVVTRDGDDVTLQDPRGRLLHSTPIELLEPAAPAAEALPIRTVDELTERIEAGLITREEAMGGSE